MPAKKVVLKDINRINTFRHPIRHKIMILLRNEGVPMTVQMISKEMNMKHGNVFYHMKKLLDADLIELVKTKIVNGITSKYYLRKHDYIYYDVENLEPQSGVLDTEYNKSIFSTVLSDFMNEVFPTEMDIEDRDVVYDALHREFHYFEPEDITTIRQELLDVLGKYDKKTETSIEYTSLLAIGKRRKNIHVNVDDIVIDD